MKRIGHFNTLFLEKSQTFIYNYITHIVNFECICLAERFINQDIFPLSNCYRIAPDIIVRCDRKILRQEQYSPIIRSNIKRIIQATRVELVHAHFGFSGYLMLPICNDLRLPLITSFYGMDFSLLPKDKKWQKRYDKLFDLGNLFICQGEFEKQCLSKIGCPHEKIVIIKEAVDLHRIESIQKTKEDKDGNFIILFAGRFVEKKGILDVLRAVRKVAEKYRHIELHLIGDGPLKSRVIDYIKINQMEGYTKLYGFLRHEDCLGAMSRADVFIHPSITAESGDSEGSPSVILEAQALGIPVISTLHANIPNIVVQNETGFLVKERYWQGLAYYIECLIDNPELIRKIGNKGRKFVRDTHDIKKIIWQLEDIYEKIISSHL